VVSTDGVPIARQAPGALAPVRGGFHSTAARGLPCVMDVAGDPLVPRASPKHLLDPADGLFGNDARPATVVHP